MTEENKKIFEDNYRHWQTLRDAGYLRGLSQYEKDNLLKAAREEFFGQGYTPDWWCPPCAIDAITGIYRRYEEWKSSQPVKANFPSNKT